MSHTVALSGILMAPSSSHPPTPGHKHSPPQHGLTSSPHAKMFFLPQMTPLLHPHRAFQALCGHIFAFSFSCCLLTPLPAPGRKVKAFVSSNDPAICARLYTLDTDVAKAAPAEDKARSLCSVLKATLQAGGRVSVQDQACLWLEARPPPPSYMPFRFLESPQQSELLQKSAVS